MEYKKLKLNCEAFGCDHFIEVTVPEDWTITFDESDHNVICSDESCHAFERFRSDQCAGCVSSIHDCSLRSAIEMRHEKILTFADIDTLLTGKCPRRHGGTFFLNPKTIEMKSLDLSTPVVSLTALGFLHCIYRYLTRYKEFYINDISVNQDAYSKICQYILTKIEECE